MLDGLISASSLVLVGLIPISLSAQNNSSLPEDPAALAGFSIEDRAKVQDTGPVQATESTLLRLLFRVGKTSQTTLNRYAALAGPVDVPKLSLKPRSWRFRVVRLAGRVELVHPTSLKQGANEPAKPVFWLRCRDSSDRAFWVFANSVPRAWQKNQMLNQPIVATGFFWRMGRADELAVAAAEIDSSDLMQAEQSLPVIVVDRPAWFPDRVSQGPLVSDAWVQLAKAGLDVGQFDRVLERNGRPLMVGDADFFEEMSEAVAKIEFSNDRDPRPWSLLELVSKNKQSVGQRTRVEGGVRQCLAIRSNDSDSKSAAASYQLTIFPDMQGQQVDVKTAEGKTVPYGRFAVTIRAPRLPNNETPQSLIGKRVLVDGFHYRFWRYDSEFARQHDLDGQIGPLVLGNRIEVLSDVNSSVGHWPAVLLVTLLAAIVGMGWWYWRSDGHSSAVSALPDRVNLEDSGNSPS